MQALLITLHVLSAVVWVGGMIFAYAFQRPAAASQLEAPERLRLWVATFQGFFPWVWAAVVLLPVTGYVYLFRYFGGMASAPLYVHLMHGIGWVMIALFVYVFLVPFRRLRMAVAAADWPSGGEALAGVRRIVGLNLMLGLLVVAIASGGRLGLLG